MTENRTLLSALETWLEVVMRHSMHNMIYFARGNNITMSQIGALFRINHKDACGVSDIGDELGISSAAASQMIDRLVQQKLIERSEDPNDRRVKQLGLTEKGHELLRESVNARQAWLLQLAAALTPEESAQITEALQILVRKTKQIEKQANPASSTDIPTN